MRRATGPGVGRGFAATVALVSVVALAQPAPRVATAAPAAERPVAARLFSDRADGVSCTFFDVALGLTWPGGGRVAHRDADGVVNGPRPWSAGAFAPDGGRVLRLDSSSALKASWARAEPQLALLLRLDGDLLRLHSREDPDPGLRPQLRLQASDGRVRYVEPAADATLDCSTYRGLGERPVLELQRQVAVALRFDLLPARLALGETPPRAELVLVRQGDAPARGRIAVHSLDSPLAAPAAAPGPERGIAARYPADEGIGRDPDVLFADAFESRGPAPGWVVGEGGGADTVADDPTPGFKPLLGRALRVRIPRGGQLGLDLRYPLARTPAGVEPEVAFLRYCLLLAPDWLGASDGGKLPGLAGTYGRAGWGGRAWDGEAGWSMRGAFGLPTPAGHPAHGRVMLGSYAYHAGSEGRFGEGLFWAGSDLAGLLEPGRWACIEQHLRLNTPGRSDGLLAVWVDGRSVYRRDNLRLRDRADIRIETAWMNVFHGGTAAAPRDMHAWIDQVVIARRYIGPPQPRATR